HTECCVALLGRRRPPSPPLFPYTTLFRSAERGLALDAGDRCAADRRDHPAGEGRAALPADASRAACRIPAHGDPAQAGRRLGRRDRKSTRLNSSHVKISYAVFCLKKKKRK